LYNNNQGVAIKEIGMMVIPIAKVNIS